MPVEVIFTLQIPLGHDQGAVSFIYSTRSESERNEYLELLHREGGLFGLALLLSFLQ